MALSTNYKTINNILINSLKRNSKKSITKQKKQFKTAIALYKKRMEANASRFLKVGRKDDLTKSFLSTVDTIDKKVVTWIDSGKIGNTKELKRQIDGLIQRSREYHIQLAKREKESEDIKKSPKRTRYGYRITAPIKTEHSTECLRRQAEADVKGYVLRDVAYQETLLLPQHPNCECFYYELDDIQEIEL